MRTYFAIFAALILLLSACQANERAPVATAPPSPTPTADASRPPAATAVKFGSITVDADELRFHFYKDVYELLDTYGAETVDLNVPLRDQIYEQSHEDENGVTVPDKSWFDFFLETALGELHENIALAAEGEKYGLEIDSRHRALADDELAKLSLAAIKSGSTFDEYLREHYGGNVNETVAARGFLLEQFAHQCRDFFQRAATPEKEDIEKYYEENSDSFDEVSFRRYAFNTPDGTDMAAVREAAQKFFDAVQDENSFVFYAENTLGIDAGETDFKTFPAQESDYTAEWLFAGDRVRGDKVLIEGDGAIYVIYFRERLRMTDKAATVRTILCTGDGDTEEAYRKAEEILADWEGGEQTEEAFAELAQRYSEDMGSVDNGGYYDDILEDGRRDAAFTDWCFDKDRKYGDTGIVDAEYGHSAPGARVIFFVERAEYWRSVVRDALRQNNYEKTLAAAKEKYPMEILNSNIDRG